jgi:hypothetical protein
MTPDAIYRALCSVDPALEPWQKCEHVYKPITHSEGYQYGWRCHECYEPYTWSTGRPDDAYLQEMLAGLPIFGDGKPRYNSVDELLALCERLELAPMIDDVRPFHLQGENEGFEWCAAITEWDERKPIKVYRGRAKTPVTALQEAILRAMGLWQEVSPDAH